MEMVQQLKAPQTLHKLRTLSEAHRQLARFNLGRLNPKTPRENWKSQLALSARMQVMECQLLELERKSVTSWASHAPRDSKNFLEWFRELRVSGPGQHDSLFPWLEKEANTEQMTWFIQHEIAGEAGFEDLTALTQLKMPTKAKLEMARNYWDEMGRGKASAMHGPMLGDVARELGLRPYDIDEIEIEPLMLANTLLGLTYHRQYAYHATGALGVIELTAPDRSKAVYLGLERLGLSKAGQRYFHLHSTIDLKHSMDWEAHVLGPLVDENPDVAPLLAEGALMRLRAGARCFEKYRRKLWSRNK